MPRIRFSHPTGVWDYNRKDPETGGGFYVTDSAVLRTLDGLKYTDETFSDYLSDDADKTLSKMGISGGHLAYSFDSKTNLLYVVTEYQLDHNLFLSEIELLKDYTAGQWSDGVGENFHQIRMNCGLAPFALVMDKKNIRTERRIPPAQKWAIRIIIAVGFAGLACALVEIWRARV
jgi:hypothetical protein